MRLFPPNHLFPSDVARFGILLLIASTTLLFPLAHFGWKFFGLPIYLAEIPLLGAALIFLFQKKETYIKLRTFFFEEKLFSFGVLLFLGGATLSYCFNPHSLSGLGQLKSFFFFPVLLSFLALLFISKKEEGEYILWLWLASLAASAWASLLIALQGWFTYDGRLSGLYESPNYLAMLLAPGLLIALYFFLRTQKKAVKIGTVFFLGIMGAALFFTRSYGAWAAFILALSCFLILSRRFFSRREKIVGTMIFLMALLLVFCLESSNPKWQSLINNNSRSSLSSREMIWKSGITIAQDNIFFGIGPGRFQEKYLDYQKFFPPYLEWAVPEPHNLYLAFLLQTGLLGIVGFFFILKSVGSRFIYIWQTKNLSDEEKLYGGLLCSLLLFFLFYGLIDTPYFKNDLALAFWLSLSLLFAWARGIRV